MSAPPAMPRNASGAVGGLHAARPADARLELVRNCLVRIAQFCVDPRWRDRVGDLCNGCDLKTAWIFWTRLTKELADMPSDEHGRQ